MHRQLAGVAGTVGNLGVVARIVWDLNESWKYFASIHAIFFLQYSAPQVPGGARVHEMLQEFGQGLPSRLLGYGKRRRRRD